MSRSQLLDNESADEVVLGLCGALVDEVGEVAEQFPKAGVSSLMELYKNKTAYWFAAWACRAVPLPFERIAFCWVRYSRSSKGTPRMV